MVIPFFTIYFTHEMKLPLYAIGVALALQLIAQRGFAIVGGYLTDKYHAKLCLVMGLFLSAIAYLGLSVTTHVASLFVFSTMIGLGNAFFNPASKAAIVNLVSTEDRPFVLTLRNTAMNIGFSCGPLLGGLLLNFSIQVIFWSAALIYAIFLIVFLFYLDTIKAQYTASQTHFFTSFKLLSHTTVLILLGFMCLFMVGYVQMDLTMPLVANALYPKWGVVYIFAVNSITVVLLAIPLASWLIKPRYTTNIIYISMLLLVFSLLLYGVAKNILVAMVAMWFFSIAEILFFPSLDSTLADHCPQGFVGRSFGLLELGGALGGSLGNVLGGFLYHSLAKNSTQSYYWLALSIPIILLSSTLMGLLKYRHFSRLSSQL